MSVRANPLRGEAVLIVDGNPCLLRPTFSALIAAEQELGPLLTLLDRAADGTMGLADIAALFWHCLADTPTPLSREEVGEAVLAQGLAACTGALRVLLGQILKGAG